LFVTPAQAGVQKSQQRLDSRLRGNDIKDPKDGFFSGLLDGTGYQIVSTSGKSRILRSEVRRGTAKTREVATMI